jgi:hypothetical protein
MDSVSCANTNRQNIESIILNSRYDQMRLEAEGQARVVHHGLYVGDKELSDCACSLNDNFYIKDKNKIIEAPLQQGQYYKIYTIPVGFFPTWYAEVYNPST